jgi:hypothetical protein
MICLTSALCLVLCLFPGLLLAANTGGGNPDALGPLSQIIAVLIALSVASERLVEIVKGFIPWLNETSATSGTEGVRKAVLQIMAVVSGIITAFLAKPAISNVLPDWTTLPGIFALGLLASGGSGFWNSFSSYILQLKNLKKEEVKEKKD